MKNSGSLANDEDTENAIALLTKLGSGGYTLRVALRFCTAATLTLQATQGSYYALRLYDANASWWPWLFFAVYALFELRLALELPVLQQTLNQRTAVAKRAAQLEGKRVFERFSDKARLRRKVIRGLLVLGTLYVAWYFELVSVWAVWISDDFYARYSYALSGAVILGFWFLVYLLGEVALSRSLKSFRARVMTGELTGKERADAAEEATHGAA